MAKAFLIFGALIFGQACNSGNTATLPRCPAETLPLVGQSGDELIAITGISFVNAGSSSGSDESLPSLLQQFTLLQISMVEESCATCHSKITPTPSGGLDLTDQNAFNQNIDKILTSIKITNPTDVKFMPRGKPALSAEVIANVELYKKILASNPPTGSSGIDNGGASGASGGDGGSASGSALTSGRPAGGDPSPAVIQNCIP